MEQKQELTKKLPKNEKELASLSISEKMKVADLIGQKVGTIMNQAVKKANKFLKKYGYQVSVTLNFHRLDLEDDKA